MDKPGLDRSQCAFCVAEKFIDGEAPEEQLRAFDIWQDFEPALHGDALKRRVDEIVEDITVHPDPEHTSEEIH